MLGIFEKLKRLMYIDELNVILTRKCFSQQVTIDRHDIMIEGLVESIEHLICAKKPRIKNCTIGDYDKP